MRRQENNQGEYDPVVPWEPLALLDPGDRSTRTSGTATDTDLGGGFQQGGGGTGGGNTGGGGGGGGDQSVDDYSSPANARLGGAQHGNFGNSFVNMQAYLNGAAGTPRNGASTYSGFGGIGGAQPAIGLGGFATQSIGASSGQPYGASGNYTMGMGGVDQSVSRANEAAAPQAPKTPQAPASPSQAPADPMASTQGQSSPFGNMRRRMTPGGVL